MQIILIGQQYQLARAYEHLCLPVESVILRYVFVPRRGRLLALFELFYLLY